MPILDIFGLLLSDNIGLLSIVGGILVVGGIWFVVNHLRKAKQDVQRRVNAEPGTFATTTLDPGARVIKRLQRSVESVAQAGGVEGMSERDVRQLRAKLVQAGYFDKSAVTFFFGLRIACAIVLATLAAGVFTIVIGIEPWTRAALGIISAFGIGYFAPLIVLNRICAKLVIEHRSGFPDFMDLMVVCVEAGLSMEAGLQRIALELKQSYPSLAMHLEIATVEMRSGKRLSAAIEAFARRLGIEEATSFATLLTQSEELGSSLSQSLRAYSDDMRNKRLMKAEEKAHSLPAKLVVPLTLFVFPTLLVVLLLPIVISVSGAKL